MLVLPARATAGAGSTVVRGHTFPPPPPLTLSRVDPRRTGDAYATASATHRTSVTGARVSGGAEEAGYDGCEVFRAGDETEVAVGVHVQCGPRHQPVHDLGVHQRDDRVIVAS